MDRGAWQAIARGVSKCWTWLSDFHFHELTRNQKNCHLEVSPSLILRNNNKPFLHQIVMCDKKWILYTISDDQLSGWTKKKLQSTSQSQTCIKRRSWSLSGGLLPVWFTTAFWIPAKPLHLRTCSVNWWVAPKTACCSQDWSTEKARFPMTMPYYMSHSQCFKSWTNWATKFCLIYFIHLTLRLSTTPSSSISKTFCWENASTTSRRQQMHFKSASNPEAWSFMQQE